MKILIAYPEELPSPQARAVQVISNAAGMAVGSGEEIHLAYGKAGPGMDISRTTGEAPPPNLHLHPLPLLRKLRLGPIRISANWIFRLGLGRAIRTTNPDWIYSRHIKLARHLLGSSRADRVIYEAHTIFSAEAANSCEIDVIQSKSKWRNLFLEEKEIFQKAGLVVATSHVLAGEIQRLFQRPDVHVFPHGVWPHHASAWNPEEGGKTILYVGQFYLWKDVDTLIHAMRVLPSDARLDLIGGRGEGDEDMKRLKLLVQSLELQDRIRFHGQMAPADLARQLSGAAVCVLTLGGSVLAARFTCPIKLFEYLAGGRPVVAPRLPIIEEMAKDAVAYYRVGNSSDLAEKLSKLLSSPAARQDLSRKALKTAVRTWPDRGRAIVDLLKSHRSGSS